MGLDMYLLAKREHQDFTGVRGACNGLIPLAPETDKEEIGYWRKAYRISSLFTKGLLIQGSEKGIIEDLDEYSDDFQLENCKEYEVSLNILKSIKFISEKAIIDDDFEDELEEKKWLNTVEFCNKAIELIKKENAKIYYMEWY